MPRISKGESSIIGGLSSGVPSIVSIEGIPLPTLRPRSPKLKFTLEDN